MNKNRAKKGKGNVLIGMLFVKESPIDKNCLKYSLLVLAELIVAGDGLCLIQINKYWAIAEVSSDVFKRSVKDSRDFLLIGGRNDFRRVTNQNQTNSSDTVHTCW